MDMFLQACVNGLLMGGFYSLMGMGQNIIFGVMKIVNFCHGEMLMVGMYLTFILYTYFGVDPYLAVPIVAVTMFCLGAVIQHTLITPSLGTKSFTTDSLINAVSLVYTESNACGNRAVMMTSPSMIRKEKRPILFINGIT